MARKNNSEETPRTEPEPAPETVATVTPVYQPAPRQMRVERQGSKSEPYVRHYPDIRGGTCEYCGVLDRNVAAQDQYKMCPHYRGMQARCSYCPDTKDPDEVIRSMRLQVVDHPDRPGTLIMVCDATTCGDAHIKRFQRTT